jgi:ferredoxin
LDSCPKDALFLDRRSRVELDENQCLDCGLCVGVCPTEALKTETFDPDAFIIKMGYAQEIKLSCKEIPQCLGIFNEEHLVSLALRDNTLICDLSECCECEINKDKKVQNDIESRIDKANIFLKHFGFKSIQKEYAKQELNRRRAIEKIFKETKSALIDESTIVHKEKNITPHRVLFQNSLKYAIEKMESLSVIDFKFSNISHKQIVYESCDNCGECVQFCPTQALVYSSDETKILFAPLHCISCGICNDICKPNAIYETNELDVISLAFNRAEILIEHTFVVCSECKVSFPQKNDETVCARCSSFILDNSNLFALAKDM